MSFRYVLYVASVSYSGSTLLDLLLGQQPDCLSLGEVHRLGLPPIERIKSFGNRCSCRERVHECEHWEELRREVAAVSGMPPEADWSEWGISTRHAYSWDWASSAINALIAYNTRVPAGLQVPWGRSVFREHRWAAEHSWMLFRVMANRTGHACLVDSTKNAARLYGLTRSDPAAHLRAVHLVRDGRGVSYSIMRRTGKDMKAAAKEWVARERALQLVLRDLPGERVIFQRYEDLCNTTSQSIKSICDFMELSFEPDNVCMPERPPHMIPGNPMSYRGDTEIKLNEDWKEKLTPQELSEFQKIGGALNARYGYSS